MKTNSTGVILVMTHLPDRDSAKRLAEHLIGQRLVACVNIMPACTSIYHWQGKIESAAEVPMQMKSTLAQYPAIEMAIRQLHPYELPEITHVHLDGGEQAYIQWIQQETQA
ncbi:MAG: divalent-cation tolerance protein CutA [Betaproteobacteria bacterium HGW-Betaproteobacteria-8]|nr:MAG: divalent-cation tolerance protein CutA [Betaproteobacteria bacterium HGW-Betaproteobacteria-8]